MQLPGCFSGADPCCRSGGLKLTCPHSYPRLFRGQQGGVRGHGAVSGMDPATLPLFPGTLQRDRAALEVLCPRTGWLRL